jgi:hypothetical protein
MVYFYFNFQVYFERICQLLSLYDVGDRWKNVYGDSVEDAHKGKTEENLPECNLVFHNLNGLTWVWTQSSALRDATHWLL